MVNAQLLAFATLLVGASALCSPNIKLQPFDNPVCAGALLRPTLDLHMNRCYSTDDMASFRPYLESQADLENWNCTLSLFSERHCKAVETTLQHLHAASGTCFSARLRTPDRYDFEQAKAVKFHCNEIKKHKSKKPRVCATKTKTLKPKTSSTTISRMTKTSTFVKEIFLKPIATVKSTKTVMVAPTPTSMTTETMVVTRPA